MNYWHSGLCHNGNEPYNNAYNELNNIIKMYTTCSSITSDMENNYNANKHNHNGQSMLNNVEKVTVSRLSIVRGQ